MGHFRVRRGAAGGKGDDPEPQLEPGMVGGTPVGWGSRAMGAQLERHKETLQAPMASAG